MNEEVIIPQGKYVFFWGGLIENAGGMTRAMLKRANEFIKCGADVKILLSARGMKQIDAIYHYKNRGYSYIEKSNFVLMQDYFGEMFSNKKKNHKIATLEKLAGLPREIDKSNLIYYNDGEIFAIEKSGGVENEKIIEVFNSEKSHTEIYYSNCLVCIVKYFEKNNIKYKAEKFIADNGFCYRRVLNEFKNNSWKDINVKLFDENSNEVLNFSSLDIFRQFFFTKYVENIEEHDIFVFCDPILDFNPGFRNMVKSDRNIYRIGINHGAGLGDNREWNCKLNPRLRDMIENQSPPQMEALILLTKEATMSFRKRFGNINILYNIPNTVMIPQTIKDFSSRHLERAVFIGRIDEKTKQITHIVRAFENVVKIFPTAQLYIYGDGPDVPTICSLIKTLNLEENVVLKGFTDNVNEVYQQAAFSIATSDFEGQGLSMMESLANGCPAISYLYKFGPADLLKDDVNGKIVEKNNIEQLSQKIIEMFDSPEKLEEMSVNSRKMICEYSEDKYLSNWIDMLNSVVENYPYRTNIDKLYFKITEQIYIAETEKILVYGKMSGEGTFPDISYGQEHIYLRIYKTDLSDYVTIEPIDCQMGEKIEWDVKFEVPAQDKSKKMDVCIEWNNCFLHKDFELF